MGKNRDGHGDGEASSADDQMKRPPEAVKVLKVEHAGPSETFSKLDIQRSGPSGSFSKLYNLKVKTFAD
jgi:hypothetical protein